MSTGRIIIQRANPTDAQDIEELVSQLRDAVPAYDIEVADEKSVGYGVTWWQVIYIWIKSDPIADAVLGALVAKIIDAGVGLARRRFKRQRQAVQPGSEDAAEPTNGIILRPTYIGLYGPDGKLLRSVLVENGQEPRDVTDEHRDGPHPMAPE